MLYFIHCNKAHRRALWKCVFLRLVDIEVSSIADSLSPYFSDIDGVIVDTFEKM